MCEYCDFKKPKPFFETMKNSVACLKSGMTGLPILEIIQYAYELDINIHYCPMCGRKLENVQASMYADVVDANMENRRLRRELWIARAERAKTEHLSKIMYSTLFRDFIEKWVNVERKCRAKAEEYK